MTPPKKISLALQGGGALGAFTWGVLDRLLADERIEIAAISGASAGAMNGVVLAEGFAQGGAEGARKKLEDFWRGIARAGQSSPYRSTPLTRLMTAFAPAWSAWASAAARMTSPYDLNPLNINPLKDVLEELVDFERVRACNLPLFIAATNVETGRIKLFKGAELTADHVLASACLPMLFHAVEIDGVPYWDGGYMGNPALFPLFDVEASRDILIVQVHPIKRPGAPRKAQEILARIDEITFNASLLNELRAVEFVQRLLAEHRVEEGRYRAMNIHVVEDQQALLQYGADADLNTDLDFFEHLKDIGHATCTRWLKRHFNDLGERSSVDLRAMFQGD